jgi:hypothetical protein
VRLGGRLRDSLDNHSLAGECAFGGFNRGEGVDVGMHVAAIKSAQAVLDGAVATAQANGQGVNAGEQQQELAAARAAADPAQASVEQLRREIARAPP